MSRQAPEFLTQSGGGGILCPQQLDRSQQLRGDAVAPTLDLLPGHLQRFRIRNPRTSQPQVRQFVREREHLRGLGVCAIDEDQRRDRIGQGETPKFHRIQGASTTAADHTANHDENAQRIRLPNEPSQRIDPCREPSALCDVETEPTSNASSSFQNLVARLGRAHEVLRPLPGGTSELPIPVLTLLAKVDGIQQIRARLAAVRARSRAKVGDRNTLDRGFAKKQVPDRREGRLRKTLQLLERRPGLPALPSLDPRKPTRERIDSQACTVPRSTKKLRLHVNAIHVLHRFQDSMRSTTFAIRSGQSNRDSIISLVMCGATKLANCILSWCLPFSFLST